MTETATQEIVLREEPLGLQLIRSLENAGELQRSGLKINGELTVEAYEIILTALGQFKRTCSFGIGDLINWGERAYPDDTYADRYDRAVALTGLRFETLRNYASVSARVALSRRRDKLSFGHHDAVAALEPDQQTEWLAAAEEHGWGRTELRERLRDANALPRRSQVQWTGGRLGSLAPELEQPALPGVPTPAPPEWPQEALGASLAPPTAPEGDSLAGAVRALLALLEPLSDGFYRVPRAAVDEVAALVAEE